MRLFGFLVALMFLFTLPAQADDAKIESIGSRIADILRPRVIELDREVMTFHYAVAESDPKVTTKAEVTEWTENIATQFFNPDAVSGDLQGVGFYVATDPHASRSYGGQHPLLFAVPIIKGAKILILSSEKPWDANDVRKVKALINEAQCGGGGQNVDFSVLEDVTRVFRNSLNRDCRQIIQSAYLQLGVQAILYNYGSDSYARGCRSRSDAFNLIAKGAVNIDHTGLYWDHGSVGDRTLTRMISQSYLDAQTDFLTRYGAILFPEHLEIPGSLKNVQAFERAAYS